MGDDDSDQGESSNNTKYYEILGVDKSASPQQIKKQYRKLARQLHPDKHPDEAEKYHDKFQELQKAYDVLGDPEKKKLYDRYVIKKTKKTKMKLSLHSIYTIKIRRSRIKRRWNGWWIRYI